MAKLSVAELKRRLPVGAEFTAEFTGMVNVRVFGNTGVVTLMKPQEEITTRRRVVKQGACMVSLILTGPKAGREIDLTWRGTQAREEDGAIILTNSETSPPEDFLKITL